MEWQAFNSPGLEGLHITFSIHVPLARTLLTWLLQIAKEPGNDGGLMVYRKVQEEEKRVWWLERSLSHSFHIHMTTAELEIGN